MASFSYKIIDKNGKEKKGTMEAATEEKVVAVLRSEGYIPISVTPQNILTKDINITIGHPVKPREFSIFCRQFVSILSAGVSLINALDMLREQTENKALSQAIKNVQTSVEKGETLAGAMRLEGKIFPTLLIQMVEAGEISGNLEIAFDRMATHFEKDAKIKAQVKKAMIYPMIVGIVALGVIFLMMVVVIPNFMLMFDGMDIAMPKLTQRVLNISEFVQEWWYLIIGLILLFIAGLQLFKRTETGRMLFGKLGLSMPLFGKLTVKSVSTRFARTLSTLLAAGIPMIDAIGITSRTMDNMVVRKALLDAKEDVAKGISLSVPLKRSGIFPPMVWHMTKIGEETGNIESMLDKVADYYDEEVEVTTQSLMAVMEPVIIVVLALVVGVLIMAIMQPMMSMYDGMGSISSI
ncbi:MAG: type II secretion system F family protein [Clostridiales bacterium]|nr:type II secretion system F family protein [Clostridiales bacterium]